MTESVYGVYTAYIATAVLVVPLCLRVPPLAVVVLLFLAFGLVPVGALFGLLTWLVVRSRAPFWVVVAWAALAGAFAPYFVLSVFALLSAEIPPAPRSSDILGGTVVVAPWTIGHAMLCIRRHRPRRAGSDRSRSCASTPREGRG